MKRSVLCPCKNRYIFISNFERPYINTRAFFALITSTRGPSRSLLPRVQSTAPYGAFLANFLPIFQGAQKSTHHIETQKNINELHGKLYGYSLSFFPCRPFLRSSKIGKDQVFTSSPSSSFRRVPPTQPREDPSHHPSWASS